MNTKGDDANSSRWLRAIAKGAGKSKTGDMSAGTLAVTQVRQKPVSLGALDGGGIRSFQTSNR